MNLRCARPDASELMFHLFCRSVHPELFTIHAESTIIQKNYKVTIRVCNTGHWVSFRTQDETVSELITSRKQLLPQRRQFLENRLRGSREETVQFDCGVAYRVCYELEQLEPEVFLNVHEELLLDCRRATVAHQFPGQNRLSPSALSLIRTDAQPDSLLIHSFHTFPENCVVVKTQSLFETEHCE